MTEPTPATETAPYRPVSGLAVAGLVLSTLFAGWLAVAAAVALRAHAPLLIQPAWLLLPFAGAVISSLGWLQVHRSEGSRVGARPAQWGLLLGVLSALSYAAWYAMTELPLRLQAQDFTNAWFDDLRQNQTDDRFGDVAFWCTLHPLRRDGGLGDLSIPDDRDALLQSPQKFQAFRDALRHRHLWGERGRKGELPRFLEQEIVQIIRQTGTQTEVEPLGVRDWTYVGGSEPGYRVEQAYRVRTPDGSFEITVPVLSRDTDRRRWQVLLNETAITQRQYTPRGHFLARLRADSNRFAFDWLKKIDDGQREEAFLDTRPAHDRDTLRRAGLPGYKEFAAGALVDGQTMLGNPKRMKELTGEIKAFFQPSPNRKITLRLAELGPNPATPYEVGTGAWMPNELIFYHPFDARIGNQYHCEGLLAVATADPKVLDLENPDPSVLPDGTSAQRNARWRIVGLRLLLGGEITHR